MVIKELYTEKELNEPTIAIHHENMMSYPIIDMRMLIDANEVFFSNKCQFIPKYYIIK